MNMTTLRDKILEEIKLIPTHRLTEIYNVIHYFRLGLQKVEGSPAQSMTFAGCWSDMPEETFNEFLQDNTQRRHQAFSRRKSYKANLD